jgi:hypothetical protein
LGSNAGLQGPCGVAELPLQSVCAAAERHRSVPTRVASVCLGYRPLAPSQCLERTVTQAKRTSLGPCLAPSTHPIWVSAVRGQGGLGAAKGASVLQVPPTWCGLSASVATPWWPAHLAEATLSSPAWASAGRSQHRDQPGGCQFRLVAVARLTHGCRSAPLSGGDPRSRPPNTQIGVLAIWARLGETLARPHPPAVARPRSAQ